MKTDAIRAAGRIAARRTAFHPLRRLLAAGNGIRCLPARNIVFQRGPRSCGAACVRMLLADHGLRARSVLRHHAPSGVGSTMLDLAWILGEHGFETRGVRFAGPADLRTTLASSPETEALLLLESERLLPQRILVRPIRALAAELRGARPTLRHWTLLERIEEGRVRLRDPSLGRIEISVERLRSLWDGLTLLARFRPERSPREEVEMGNMVRPAAVSWEATERTGTPPPVVLDDVSMVYDERVLAVRRVTWTIREGEIFCLLGPNGAGKTTLVKMMTGFLPPTSGRILLDGFDLSTATEGERAALRRSIGYMPERPFLCERLTPREYLTFVGELYGRTDRERLVHRIDEQLRSLRLEEKGDVRIGGLSHGMRRKVAFIAAQLHEPRLLLLDEPTAGLDPASARLVKDRMGELRDARRAVLFTTHVLEIAERLADRIGVLDRGSLHFVGTLEEMRAAAGRPGATLEELFMQLTEPTAEGNPADAGERSGT